MKKVITYNINGLRSAISKGFWQWLEQANPDVICLQEIKARPEQIGIMELEMLGYYHYWYPAEKAGYSGVAVFTKQKPIHVHYGCDNALYDREGRFLRVDFDTHSVVSVYHPSGSSGEERQKFKMQWLDYFLNYVEKLRAEIPNLILSGDYNICHKPMDIHSPERHENMSGFLPEERAWFDSFVNHKYIDTFREFNKEMNQYTWWSYRAGARDKNLGWRIDYNMVTDSLKGQLKRSVILKEVVHSDHCPVLLELDV